MHLLQYACLGATALPNTAHAAQAVLADGVPQMVELASLGLEVLSQSGSAAALHADGLCTAARDLVQGMLGSSHTVVSLPLVSLAVQLCP